MKVKLPLRPGEPLADVLSEEALLRLGGPQVEAYEDVELRFRLAGVELIGRVKVAGVWKDFRALLRAEVYIDEVKIR